MKYLALLLVAACGGTSDADYKQAVVTGMQESISVDLQNLITAAQDLQAAAPTGHGWDVSTDGAALANMKEAWRRARTAYEHVEGATAPIFPDEDYTMDARYDDFLAKLGPAGDPDLFDDHGATGMHAIERILYADSIPQKVIDFEKTLPGYRAAAWPTNASEADEFATELCQKLITDAMQLHAEWTPANIDIGPAFQGLVGLMNEQKEKVNLAATGEEESRYAQLTLFDLRNNLDGTTKIYDLFQPWILAKGGAMDATIQTGFHGLDQLYSATPSDRLPPVPDTWSSDMPTATDLATPFGTLWAGVHHAVDPTADGSVVFEMNHVAVELGFPEFVEE
ncbi:MAG TPA: EfeM/EfeO family lipoprotein [Kofleriaceae bacterium]|nr:EfeM/EfeO family lipoprotein [Kofleriaceae bacterium]